MYDAVDIVPSAAIVVSVAVAVNAAPFENYFDAQDIRRAYDNVCESRMTKFAEAIYQC